MPAPAKIDLDGIVHTARDVLEQRGETGLTMQAVATALGVRAPSLYKHVRDREALLELVMHATLDALAARLASVPATEPADRIRGLARATRAFGAEWPVGKAMAFGRTATVADRSLLAATAAPLTEACVTLAGPELGPHAARTLTAWMHGFTEMERAGAFRLGADVDDSFRFGLDLLVDAMRGA